MNKNEAHDKLDQVAWDLLLAAGNQGEGEGIPKPRRKQFREMSADLAAVRDSLDNIPPDNAEELRLRELHYLIRRLGLERDIMLERYEDIVAKILSRATNEIYHCIQARRCDLGDPDADIVEENLDGLLHPPTVGDRVHLDGDPEETGEVMGDEVDGVAVRWDGGDYSTVAASELVILPEQAHDIGYEGPGT